MKENPINSKNEKYYSLSQLKTGMILSRNVYKGFQLLLSKGTEIDFKTISQLKAAKIYTVYAYEDIKLKEEVKNKVSFERREKFERFKDSYGDSREKISRQINEIVFKNLDIDENRLLEDVDKIINVADNNLAVMEMLKSVRGYDDSTYVHSINVAMICNVFGKWLGMSGIDVKDLTLAGLLHDIGKLKINDDILMKPDKLTEPEYNHIKRHTVYGYEILKDKKIDSRVKYAALMHHERCDGSGYPQGRLGDQIPEFAKIVAIADVYDAMTADRVYRKGLNPFEAINFLEEENYIKFDARCKFLLEKIAESFINDLVSLDNNEKGKIAMINKDHLSRPLIVTDEGYINLAQNKDKTIKSIKID